MNRHLLGILLGVGIVVVTTQTTVFSEDKVERKQSDKLISVSGKITDESLAGVKIKAGAKETVIPTTEITRVFYEEMPLGIKQAYVNLWNLDENEKDHSKVLKAYLEFQPKANAAPAPVKRQIEYRIATLQASIADTKEQKTEAKKALQGFVSGNPGTWQFPLASRTLARMQVESSEFDAAQRTLEGIVKSAAIPADLKQEADLMLIDVLFQAGKTEDVKNKITTALADLKTTEQLKTRFSVYQAAIEAKSPNAKMEDVIKNLDGIISKATDPAVKALAYNVMGDCYAAGGTKEAKRQAMWSYLWVDVVYNQDRGEHVKAMNNLLKIFEDDKDTEKVQLYKEKIARMK